MIATFSRPTFWNLIACLLFVSCTALAEPTSQPRDVSSLLSPLIERHHVPGMVAALVEGDQVVAIGAAGVRRAGTDDKTKPADPFHIGSCSKAMTATLIAMLVEEGKLSWETTLAQAFPEAAGKMHPDYRGVTLAQLLHHASGFPSDTSVDDTWRLMRDHRGSLTAARRDLLLAITAHAPDHAPGGERVYANANYAVAAHMAETATSRPYEDLLRKRLFEPLHMTSAGFGPPGERSANGAGVPWGHDGSGKPIRPGPMADNPPPYNPSGRVHCNIGDWAKFISLHLAPSDEKPPRLLSQKSLDMLHAPVGGDGTPYAMGWIAVPREWAGSLALTHTGTNTHWFAVAWLAPNRRFAVLAACNIGGDEAAKACDEAASALIGEHFKHSK